MTSAVSQVMLRENFAVNDANFYITKDGNNASDAKIAYFDIPTDLTSDVKITIPTSDVTLGSASSIAANNITSGTGAVAIDTTGGTIGIGTNTETGTNINIGIGAVERTITIGNTTDATGLALNSGTGGITLASTGGGDIAFTSGDNITVTSTDLLTLTDGTATLELGGTGATTLSAATTVDLDCTSTMQLNSSGGVISIGNDDNDFAINVGINGERTITVGNATGATGLVLTSGTGKTALTSTNTALDSIKLSTTTGGITLASMTSGSGAFGTNVEGTRFFKVDETIGVTSTVYTFDTGTNFTEAVYYVEVAVAIRDTVINTNSGSYLAKAVFNKTAANTITKMGDSFETLGSPLGQVTFGESSGDFTITFSLSGGSNDTNFDGSIRINTEDTELVRTS